MKDEESIFLSASCLPERPLTSPFFNYDPEAPIESEPAAQVFLPTLDADDWERLLSVAQRLAFRAGDTVIEQGESTRAFYVVASGRLEVLASDDGREQRLHQIEPMSIFGEQAFFDGLPRSATVRGLTDGQLFGITPEAFEILAAKHPDHARMALFDLGRILSLRLRAMTELTSRRTHG